MISRALLDTSVFVARESGRPLDTAALPGECAISTVTVAELQLGVLAATDVAVRSRRIATLAAVGDLETLPIDTDVAATWALLRVQLAQAQRRMGVNDLWIAATALAHDLPVVTQEAGFDVIAEAGGLTVVRV
ncbi:MAG TPA: type II toxin-antitoxin system VapC family toxin [Solirubrobacter sp.]|nr:type II toxin-antitoxin system VapC family toxin [Solirubrobacter sp.]